MWSSAHTLTLHVSATAVALSPMRLANDAIGRSFAASSACCDRGFCTACLTYLAKCYKKLGGTASSSAPQPEHELRRRAGAQHAQDAWAVVVLQHEGLEWDCSTGRLPREGLRRLVDDSLSGAGGAELGAERRICLLRAGNAGTCCDKQSE
jgi:hypothetical protein